MSYHITPCHTWNINKQMHDTGTSDLSLYCIIYLLWPPMHKIRWIAFWVIRAFQHISPYHPAPFAFCAVPLEARGKIRLQSNSKIVLTQTHFLMLQEGGCSDCGMSQCLALRYLTTSAADGMPFWQSDYGQSDIDLKGARWEENVQGPICGSCWAKMRWGNGRAHLRGCY